MRQGEVESSLLLRNLKAYSARFAVAAVIHGKASSERLSQATKTSLMTTVDEET
jgi:hypothetical protein